MLLLREALRLLGFGGVPLLVVWAFAATAGVLAVPRFGLARHRYPLAWCTAWCLGVPLGLAILHTSPGARWRRAQQPEKASRSPPRSWPGPWATRGGSCGPSPPRRPTWPPWPWASCWDWPSPSAAPRARAPSAPPRAGPDGPCSCCRPSWSWPPCSWWLSGCAAGTGGPAVALVTLAALVPALRQLTSDTVDRGLAWDRQNARIRAQVADGARDVGYRPLPIGNLAEPFYTRVYRSDWAARCVSEFYGVDRIHRL
ncbi:hypothetical protein [Streptomyces sp. NPDC086023]|uniref:hypothetical protein n=1 Tax=Streptomyces sp. NPDC086023 TaxID=3365746 RepID=UPI0037D2D522